MYKYIISETRKGNFIVQRPNDIGGLYPMIPDSADCRNTADCLRAIHEDISKVWGGGAYEDFSVELQFQNDPDNIYTQ